MATEITMPKLSDTMTEGLFACWRKNIGDQIERGDILAEVETDKAVMELEAFASGILIQTMVKGGENVAVGSVLGLIGTAAELGQPDIKQTASPVHEIQTPEPEEEAPSLLPQSVAHSVALPSEVWHEKASPLVRRLAREKGIELDQVKGSGPEGRITQEDLAAFSIHRQEEPKAATPVPPQTAEALSERIGLSPMRQAVTDTVTLSWQSIPHFTVTVEINMSGCREIRRELHDRPTAIGYNALIIKACVCALRKYPLLCADAHASSNEIHIGFAVSLPDGLLVPVIRQCQRLSVTEIEIESSRLADRSRAGRLASEEMAGGSFSVSNLGMYGVDEFTALIIPGQVAILAVGAVCERAVVRNSHLAVAPTMRVTLSCDHRSVDGAYAASFLAELRTILEKPVSLLV